MELSRHVTTWLGPGFTKRTLRMDARNLLEDFMSGQHIGSLPDGDGIVDGEDPSAFTRDLYACRCGHATIHPCRRTALETGY
jgi:hypothetical protein